MKANKSTIIAMLVVGVLSFNTTALFAANENPVASDSGKPSSVTVSYIGTQDKFIYFQIELNQPSDDRSVFTISDKNGEQLFMESVNKKTHTRKIKVLQNEINNLEFAFATRGGIVKKSYSIDVEQTEKIVVKEVAKL
jgi:hypothetical protein